MDILVYPGLRRIGFVARPVFRIFFGLMFGSAAMIYGAVLQHFIYKSTRRTLAAPPYVLIAMREIFASITGLEYAYNKGPKRITSLVMAAFPFTTPLATPSMPLVPRRHRLEIGGQLYRHCDRDVYFRRDLLCAV